MKPIPTVFAVLSGFLTAVPPALAAPPNFQDDVLPVFKEHCLNCHNPDKKKAGLDLTTLQSLAIGSSGGEVVKAGVPDTSVLYMVMDHHEDYEPMPPKKPKVPEADLKLVHAWIAGGLLESAGGKSQLRDVSFNLAVGSANRPENPAIPVDLAEIPLARTNVPPPVIALASSPWADVVATSGHEQILLYGREAPPNTAPGFEPVASGDLVSRRTFDDRDPPGKTGGALLLEGAEEIPDETVPADLPLQQGGAFSLSTWIQPDLSMESPTIYGRHSFYIFLERRKGGWTVRAQTRSKDNAITYYGRIGQISEGDWQHVAVTCDGVEWAFYFGGEEIVRQPIPEDKPGFLVDERPFHIGGDGQHEERRYRGGIDDLRIYRRALTPSEIQQIVRNTQPRFAHIGTLPFPEGTIHDLRFSRNGNLLVAAGGIGAHSGSVAIYDVKTGERQATIGDEQDAVLTADISADHQFVAIGTPARMVKIFSAETGQMLHRIEKHTDWVTAVRFSPDGKLLATGDRNGGIHVWETANAGIVYTLDEHKVKVTALSWRPDGQLLASAGEDGKFVLWDMKDGWPTRTATVHAEDAQSRYSRRTGILDIAFSRDGRLVTTGRDRALRLWMTDGSPLGEVRDIDSLPTRAAFSPDGDLAYTGDLGGNLRIWDVGTKQEIQVIQPAR